MPLPIHGHRQPEPKVSKAVRLDCKDILQKNGKPLKSEVIPECAGGPEKELSLADLGVQLQNPGLDTASKVEAPASEDVIKPEEFGVVGLQTSDGEKLVSKDLLGIKLHVPDERAFIETESKGVDSADDICLKKGKQQVVLPDSFGSVALLTRTKTLGKEEDASENEQFCEEQEGPLDYEALGVQTRVAPDLKMVLKEDPSSQEIDQSGISIRESGIKQASGDAAILPPEQAAHENNVSDMSHDEPDAPTNLGCDLSQASNGSDAKVAMATESCDMSGAQVHDGEVGDIAHTAMYSGQMDQVQPERSMDLDVAPKVPIQEEPASCQQVTDESTPRDPHRPDKLECRFTATDATQACLKTPDKPSIQELMPPGAGYFTILKHQEEKNKKCIQPAEGELQYIAPTSPKCASKHKRTSSGPPAEGMKHLRINSGGDFSRVPIQQQEACSPCDQAQFPSFPYINPEKQYQAQLNAEDKIRLGKVWYANEDAMLDCVYNWRYQQDLQSMYFGGIVYEPLARQIENGRFESGRSYDLTRTLGCGSFGQVFMAKAKKSHNRALRFIVKMINDKRRFNCGEAAVPLILKHKNLTRFYGFINTPTHIELLQEYAGISLDKYTHMHGPLEEEVIVDIAYQLLKGVEHLHKHHTYHRDIKPENIGVMPNMPPVVKLMDFGAALTPQDVPDIGGLTVGYCPPEVCEVLKKVYIKNHPTTDVLNKAHINWDMLDMYSVGCVIIYMYRGGHMWQGIRQQANQVDGDDWGGKRKALINLIDHVTENPNSFIKEIPSDCVGDMRCLVEDLCAADPQCRPSARQALGRRCFKEAVMDDADDVSDGVSDNQPASTISLHQDVLPQGYENHNDQNAPCIPDFGGLIPDFDSMSPTGNADSGCSSDVNSYRESDYEDTEFEEDESEDEMDEQ